MQPRRERPAVSLNLTGAHARFGELDSLRCFAMAGVVAQHCHIFPMGWVGVWLFYVLSGFVVTTAVTKSRVGQPPGKTLSAFYLRRAARILPIYLLFIGVGVVWTWAAGAHVEGEALLSLLFFYNNFAAAFGAGNMAHWEVGHLWTISVEMQFYALFGVALVFFNRRALNITLMAAIILCPILRWIAGEVLIAHGVAPEAAAFGIYSASVLHFDAFALGGLVALNLPAFTAGKRPFYLLGAALAAFLFYAGGVMLDNAFVRGQHGVDILRDVISGILFGGVRHVALYSVVNLLSAALIVLAVSGRIAPLSQILSAKALQFVGARSYGAYVVHTMVLIAASVTTAALLGDWSGSFWTQSAYNVIVFIVALSGTIALASLSYATFERPIMRWAAEAARAPPFASSSRPWRRLRWRPRAFAKIMRRTSSARRRG